MKELLRLMLSRAALLPLSLLALSCGGGGTSGPPKDPPQATLSVPKPNVAGPKITVMVGATGCDVIQSLQIYDREDLLKTVPYSGPGTVPVDLAANEVKYTRGLAVQMSLKAKVTCTDGRSNDSQPQPATFFPAAEVIDPPAAGGQVVTDNFVTEGVLPLIYFIGCGNDVGGIPKLYKVEKNSSKEPQTAPLPFLCTNETVITPKHPGTGKRWVWTPNAGAVAIDSNLTITGKIESPIDLLVVGPDGDAIVYDAGSAGSLVGVGRVSPIGTNVIKWTYTPRGFVINAPTVGSTELLVATVTANNAPTGRANILVSRVSYANGSELGAVVVRTVTSDNPIPTTAPPSVFSPDGTLLYMADSLAGGNSQVSACLTNGNGCSGTTLRWTSTLLTGSLVALVPYAGGSRLAAIAPQKVWFLDTGNGAVTNKGGVNGALSPEGGLVVLQVQSGAPPNALAFYLLNGPPPQQNLPSPQPLEIVATDDPAKGELYRYQINAGSIAVATDDNGTLWMRAGGSLVRPLPLDQYRLVRPVTP